MRRLRALVSRDNSALLVAALLHVLAWSAIRESGSPSGASSSSSPATTGDLEIELQPADGEPHPTEPPPTHGGRNEPRASAHPERHDAPRLSEPSAGLPEADPATEEPLAMLPETDPVTGGPSSELAGEPRSDASPPTPTIDFGIGEGAWQRWIVDPSARAPRADELASRSARRPAARAPIGSQTGGLREGLEARDRSLGLGPSGRVISALRGAARHRDAPQLGKARFDVTITRAGAVEVSLKSFSDSPEAWQSVARNAAENLRRNPPRIPSGRSGARLTLDLVADEAFPNGLQTKSLRGLHAELAPPRFQSSEESKKELTELNPTAGTDGVPLSETLANAEVPGLFASGQGKACKYRAGVTPLGTLQAPSGNRERDPGAEFRIQGACEPSNLGAKAQRVVRVAVVEELMF